MKEVRSVQISLSELIKGMILKSATEFCPVSERGCAKDDMVPLRRPRADREGPSGIGGSSNDVVMEEVAYEEPNSPPEGPTYDYQIDFGYDGFQTAFTTFQDRIMEHLDEHGATLRAINTHMGSIDTRVGSLDT